jgi:hypothetical protein
MIGLMIGFVIFVRMLYPIEKQRALRMSKAPVSLRGSGLNIDPKMMNGLTPQVTAVKNAARSCFAACEEVM